MTNKTHRLVLGENFQGTWAAVIAAPFGRLGIQTGIVDGSLMVTQVCYLPTTEKLVVPKDALAELVESQCQSYFKDSKFAFDLPMAPAGTHFQNKVWEQINGITAGHTLTYGEVAKNIRSAPRAVGQACGSNPYPLIVPCHRVVAATGIGGFVHQDGEGFHRQVKTWLLNHEGVI
jgi:methylated-DNA-[protein]-cysteine S-methyltransferase